MAFSLINTLLLKQKIKFSIFKMAILYELNQKYSYYMKSNIKKNIEKEIYFNKIELLKNNRQEELFKSYYHNLILSNKIKTLMNNYIDNIIKILAYKNIFNDSITYQLDESNENIISAKIKFFEQNNKIENLSNIKPKNKNIKNNTLNKIKENSTNLYIIIYLLKMEQFYFSQLIKSINKIKISKNLPIFIIFKYFIFFDFFRDGKIPDEIVKKLFSSFDGNDTNLYNSIITKNDYSILKRRYQEQNNKIGSKIYVIIELKKEIRTKYFSEDGALKFGNKQKDIINEKMDILMPNEFSKSHKNAIKQLIICNKIKYNLSKQSYFFNKENTFLYSSNFEVVLIYNISKNLIVMLESYLNYENDFRFMLNNKFEVMSISKNFEDVCYLNKKILELLNINLLDIIKIKQEIIRKKFEFEYKKITYQKSVQKVKINEYLIPELFLPPGDKIFTVVKSNDFRNSKFNMLSNILNKNIKEDENNNGNIDDKNEIEEEKSLIKKENIKNLFNKSFIEPRDVIFHKNYNIFINKRNFIENLYKELTKSPESDVLLENDKENYNLILSAKKLISNLMLKRNEFANNILMISIKFSFYYDKPFYFITIQDEKKSNLKFYKKINLENNDIKKISLLNKNKIPYNKNEKKSRNKDKKNSINGNNKKINNDPINNNFKYQYNNYLNKKENEKIKTLDIINKNKKYINKVEFIRIIKFILSFIIIFIIVIYLILINFQKYLIEKLELILLAYYYNLFTKNILITIYSILLNTYYDFFILENLDISNDYYILYLLGNELKGRYHNYTIYFYDYNSVIDHDLNIIFKKKNFTKLRGYWEEIIYESKYSSELDYIIYNILAYNPYEFLSYDNYIDLQNFLFFKNRVETKEKINCVFVKLLYYICANHEFVYKDLFKEIEDTIYNSYKTFVNINLKILLSLELIGLFLYIIFFITVFFYLYFSNTIIIKNIIFLFLDYNLEENDEKTKISYNNKINLKLIEFQNIINDFNLDIFEKFSKNINSINQNKYNINSFIKNNSNALSNNTENLSIGNIPNSKSIINKSNNFKDIKLRTISNKNILDKNNNKNIDNILLEPKSKNTNNSSINHLEESNTKFFKDNLNNNSINGSKNILSFDIIKNKNNFSRKNLNNINLTNNSDNKKENKLNLQDIILNKSNKSLVLMIEIYFIIIGLLLIIAISFIAFKIKNIYLFNFKFNKFFSDLTVLTDRYIQVYYYFNILRTLLIFPKDERKKKFEDILENMNYFYERDNNIFNEILNNNMNEYPETFKLINIIKNNKNNSTNYIKETICKDAPGCDLYLASIFNIFDSGVELGFTTSLSDIYNFFMDYKQLKNKEDINEIKLKIIFQGYKFFNIMISLNYFYIYLAQKIFLAFELDEMNFSSNYLNITYLLNIISIIFSILVFCFVIIIVFISISDFAEPIKDATYRINCSFYYIRKYTLKN